MTEEQTKHCRPCAKDLPLSSFRALRWQSGTPGHYSYCKACEYAANLDWRSRNRSKYDQRLRRAHLKRLYGISLEEYEELLAAQGGTCAHCDATHARPNSTMHLAVDHDHLTGRIRGLVCNRHNAALADFGDGESGLRRALAYVRGEPLPPYEKERSA